jgi:GNAT superfamily N-acetyltransferase
MPEPRNATETIRIESLHELPPELFTTLLEESRRAGFRFIERLIGEWEGGRNRFDQPGEQLFGAFLVDSLIAVGGLNIDPFAAESRCGRVRHLFVLQAYRRRGVGRHLMARIIAAARTHFTRLRLRTNTPDAAAFYETLGFQRYTDAETATHLFDPTRGVDSEPGRLTIATTGTITLDRKGGEP